MSFGVDFSSVFKLPRRIKQMLVLLVDCIAVLTSVWLAFYLRIDQIGRPVLQQGYVYGLAVIIFIPLFTQMGLYRAIFRYSGMPALVATTTAVSIYGVMFFLALLLLELQGVPRSIGIIQPIIFLLMAGAWRVMARSVLARALDSHAVTLDKKQLIIYGAGEAGVQTASALDVMCDYVVRAFVDDDLQKIGRTINGVPVIAAKDVENYVLRHDISDILLAIPSLERQRRRTIIDELKSFQVHVRTLPGMMDLASGKISISDFRELDIEDLLGRPPVSPNATLLSKNLRDKVVLVTGAGGSIGSELCRQIVHESPKQLVLLEHNEYGLYSIHRELQLLCLQLNLKVDLVPRLGSIRNLRRLLALFDAYRPHSVFHAAAYKHVPLVQSNPSEGVLNNVFGTLNVARAAIEVAAENFVLISTDKAVRPTNVMGATKRMAELVIQAMASSHEVDFGKIDERPTSTSLPLIANNTNFCMVRFGNVLGSSGSVVPLFRKQLKSGGPLTVTHEEVTRYFMTIPEAAQLVLQAGAMGQGGEVFVLDMGAPVKIIDLARRMVQLSGMTIRDELHPHGDVSIEVVGLRPGEKLYEELLIGDNPEGTGHERIMKAHEHFLPWDELLPYLLDLRRAAKSGKTEDLHRVLTQLVSGYKRPHANGEIT